MLSLVVVPLSADRRGRLLRVVLLAIVGFALAWIRRG